MLSYVIGKCKEIANLYGYGEVITPIVESYDLLCAKSGEEIRNRMFSFKDLGNRTVALRPEFTASIARLIASTLRNEPKPIRVFSVGSVYRYDEPQRGRYREFWQSNFELIGSDNPEADVEVILLTDSLMKNASLQNYAIKVGHIGVIRGILEQENITEKTQNKILQLMDKKEYEAAFKLVQNESCVNTLRNLLEKQNTKDPFETVKRMQNILKGAKKAEPALENLFEILKLASESGCQIHSVEPAFARGLEYYTGMIFEVYIPELDIALGGGGRYDKLVEGFGGEPTPAVGVAHGLDRIVLSMDLQKAEIVTDQQEKRVLVVPIHERLKIEALRIAQILRNTGIFVEFEVMGRRMTKALEDADRRKLDYAVIVGERELKKNAVVLRDLRKHEQKEVKIKELAKKIKA